MDKYLLEILKEVNMIIIPGLGALTITDASTGEIMFMSYLKHDDGRLISYISEKEGIEEIDAKNMISKYVREITNILDKGESYDMYQFGSFYKDENGDIQFKNFNESAIDTAKEDIPAPKEITVEPVVVQPESVEDKIVETTPEQEAVEVKPEEVTAEKVIDPDDKKTKETIPSPKEKIKAEKPKKEKVTVAKVSGPDAKKELNILEKEEKASVQAKLDTLRKKNNEKTKKKRSPVFYVLIAVVAVLLSGTGYIIYDFEGAQQYLPFLASADKNENNQSSDSDMIDNEAGVIDGSLDPEASQDLASEDIVDPEEIIDETKVAVDNTEVVKKKEPVKLPVKQETTMRQAGSYHIIAGTFAIQSNVENYAATLRAQGINSSIVEESGLYQISLGSYESRQEAKMAMDNMNLSVNARVHKVD